MAIEKQMSTRFRVNENLDSRDDVAWHRSSFPRSNDTAPKFSVIINSKRALSYLETFASSKIPTIFKSFLGYVFDIV